MPASSVLNTASTILKRVQRRQTASVARWASNQAHVFTSRELMNRSQRALLLPFKRSISGGAPSYLVGLVRKRLADRSLFVLAVPRVLGGRGTGKPCAVCGQPILSTHVQYEVTEPEPAYTHVSCYAVWCVESKTHQKSPPDRWGTPPEDPSITTEELLAGLKRNTDLASLIRRVCRANLPWVVVSASALAAWEREDPAGWTKVSKWLAAKGVGVVRI